MKKLNQKVCNINLKLKKSLEEKPKDILHKTLSKKRTYTKFKYKGEIYKIGDSMMIQDQGGKYSIAKLLSIIPSSGIKEHSLWPSIKVQWYYSKTDINREKNGLNEDINYNSLSNFEVFNSPHTDIIYIETVVCKCFVVSLEDYCKLEEPSEVTYFQRAEYDPIKQFLKPPYDKWEKICKCKTPFNPDVLYLKCDKCMKYYHPYCVGINEEEAEKLDLFFCDECKEKQQKEGNI